MSRVILRDDSVVGAEVTDVISFSHASFDPADGGFCTFIAHIMSGSIDSVRYVPEPGSLALLGLERAYDAGRNHTNLVLLSAPAES